MYVPGAIGFTLLLRSSIISIWDIHAYDGTKYEFPFFHRPPSLDDTTEKKYSEIKKSKLYPLAILKEAYSSILSDDLNLDELPEVLNILVV